ncbi:YjbF family lipoprotein [Paracoccus luteus]|uniref:YjbF family lipoprotein n=1 Tax=Paracoccus luteus TaxID=2508543 RepID=UPI001FE44FD5|nr:YjbF family lipoprotein [Paracoccus luteus]
MGEILAMTVTFTRGLAALAVLATLTACGNTASDGPSNLGIARQALGQVLAGRRAAPAAPAPDPQAMAAEALAVNKGPLIMVGLESMGTTQVLAMTGQNGGMRTYMTKNEQAVIMRGFMLTGTRGLGNDLSVAEAAGSAALIGAGRSGAAQRTMRIYSADGLERPLVFDCRIGPGPRAGVMVEDCAGHGLTFQNSYLPGAGVSRQWAGPGLGYVTVQTLRP